MSVGDATAIYSAIASGMIAMTGIVFSLEVADHPGVGTILLLPSRGRVTMA